VNLKKTGRQYGLWDSPITPVSLARGLRFSDVTWDEGGALVWLEGRSDRNVLVVQPPDGNAPRDLNDTYSARARVGYGGGDFCMGGGNVYFVEAESKRIYRQPVTSGTPTPITPAFGATAAPTLSPDGKWLLFINSYEDQDVLALVDTDGKFWPQKVASGADFYMQPAWHPDGLRIAWIEWNHPNMPWDGTTLRMAEMSFPTDQTPVVKNVTTIAGDENTSIYQPEFSPDGRFLAYVSDDSGWWQLYLYDLENGKHRQITHELAEHGSPAWIQGLHNYGFDPQGKHIYFLRNKDAQVSLWSYEIEHGTEERLNLDIEYTYMAQISVSNHGIALIASAGREPTRVIVVQPTASSHAAQTRIVRRSVAEEIPAIAYSDPHSISWEGMDGGTAHGIYYPPQSDRFEGIGLAPLVVKIHGGPTSQRYVQFDASNQYFATRGYAVLEVNYRGSTGYGREYRNKLRQNWGIYDVQDAVSGAQHLINQGLVDGSKVVIMGGSAGGFTVVKALEDHPGFFKAGINLFGVTNQFTLAADTHKFEQHYTDTLLGPLPEASSLYRERSPIFFADKIQDPIAVFQGEDDVVVPHAQSDELVESLRRRGIPHIYHLYAGEGHGFRKEKTIEHMYTEIEKFLRQYVIYI